ncbi:MULTISPECIES: YfjI family protein [unclassified Beijerinckia]|uniref:YfjI family protein n=1 Tax=unclassified Beijerinckia TaxID=2638183 RepID=UPI0008989D61|nr:MULTISPECIES: YfjI family protein [unclassified Beijerinckia]MDH7797519.1 hypothetical protein [Beijerinckia sp. GAS462]SEC88871.1 putative DNA primase/helicase [Beijerinckia sp. 28-YEA-48]
MQLVTNDIPLEDAIPNDHAAMTPREWSKPKPIPSGLLPVAAFNHAYVPDAIGGWIMDISDRLQCPPDFVAVSAVTALSAALGAKVAIGPQQRTSWTEAANLWALVVGRPGALKSPAMQEAMRPLFRMEDEARAINTAAMTDYANQMEAYKIQKAGAADKAKKAPGVQEAAIILSGITEPDKPKVPRYVVNDCTFESLGEILANSPDGVLSYRDEIVSLFKQLDAAEQAPARGFFLSSWGGLGSYTFDRIGRGHIHIPRCCVSMLGSTQPGKLAEYLAKANSGGNGDDGFIQRFGLLVWPDGAGDWKDIDRWPDATHRDRAVECFERLYKLTPAAIGAQSGEYDAIPVLRFDDEALEYFQVWRSGLEGLLRSGELSPALESHFAKYRKLVPALALINHVADVGHGPVGIASVAKAEAFATYLDSHARRAYGSGQELEAGAARAVLRRIRRGDLIDGFTARDIRRAQWSGLSSIDMIKAGLELLSDLNWIAPVQLQTNGRPKTIYAINPEACR